MKIAAITKHRGLADRVRAAFEPKGHQLITIPGQLQALAEEPWNDAQLLIVDAAGDPLDGIRFCHLMRGDSKPLFGHLPMFLVFEQPIAEVDPKLLISADVDGFLHAEDGVERITSLLGPVVEGRPMPRDIDPVPLLASGLPGPLIDQIRDRIDPNEFTLHTCHAEDLGTLQEELRAPILLLGADPVGGKALRQIRDSRVAVYTILIGPDPHEGILEYPPLSSGTDWVPSPPSSSLLRHACRRGLAWLHARRVHRELQAQINDMHEQRLLLESETSSLRSEVLTDPLTELLNRRAFNQNLDLAINQWVRHRRPFVLIIGDIDYFKLINDRFGHLVGDEVLKVLAERIRASLRRSDLAFRIGGEEFAIILMETGLQAGAEVADKLRRRIDENPIQLESGQSIFPTVSFGVGAPGDDDSASLCAAVDEALYIAKHKGRNRIELAQEKPSAGT